MKLADYKTMRPGLYNIFWKSGGSSLTSIGILPNGNRWIAPINWVRPSEDQDICEDIEAVVLIAPRYTVVTDT